MSEVPTERFFYFPGLEAEKSSFAHLDRELWKELRKLRPWSWYSAAYVAFTRLDDPERFKQLTGKYVKMLTFDISNGQPTLCTWRGKHRQVKASDKLLSTLIDRPEELILRLDVIAVPDDWSFLCQVVEEGKAYSGVSVAGHRPKNAEYLALQGPFNVAPQYNEEAA